MKMFVIAVLGVGLLTACGGGGSGSGGVSNVDVNRDLLAYASESQRLLDKHEDTNSTSPANLPSGEVRYRGVGVINTNPNEAPNRSSGVIGKARVGANFDTNTMDARVEDFVDTRTGQIVNGKLFIRDGSIRDGAMVGPITGTLDGGAISGVGEGGIYGERGEALAMGTNGSISGGGFDGEFEGAIIAER